MRPGSLILLTMIFCAEARALTPCPLAIPAREPLKDVAVKAMDVVMVGEADRRTAAQYGAEHKMSAESVEGRYAATGDIDCPFNEGQAQVTITNDVITSAAHNFFTPENCKKKIEPRSCTFTIKVGGRPQKYQIGEVAAAGFKCPATSAPKEGDDWIVLKLRKAVDPRVKPYEISYKKGLDLARDTPVTFVSKSIDWPPGATGSLASRPRHYGDCHTGLVKAVNATGRIETDCDSGHGASGGSLLIQGANPVLLGVEKAGTYQVNAGCDPNVGKEGHTSYQEGCWMNYATPVTGAFREAIAKAAGIVVQPESGEDMPKIKL